MPSSNSRYISASNPWLTATCSVGSCEAIDLANTWVTECVTDLDCVVRVPDCCPCGADTSPWQLIAVNASRINDLTVIVCDAQAACPECAPIYPPEVVARCDQNTSHCVTDMLSSTQ